MEFSTTLLWTRFLENFSQRLFVSGPGQYNIPGMGADSMKRAYIESTRRGVFGTTAARIKPMGKTFEAEAPGPAHYQVKEKPFAPRYQQMSSNFASTSYRIQDPGDPVKVSHSTGVVS